MDEAMDVLEELFVDEGVKLNTIVQSEDSNEEMFFSHVAGTKGTTVIDSYWSVDLE